MATTTGNCANDEPVDELIEVLIADDVQGLAAAPLEFGGNWLGVMYAGMRDAGCPRGPPCS